MKNYQLSREGLINLGRYPSKQNCTNKRKICINYAINSNSVDIVKVIRERGVVNIKESSQHPIGTEFQELKRVKL